MFYKSLLNPKKSKIGEEKHSLRIRETLDTVSLLIPACNSLVWLN